jgi:hypothetical protein
MNRLVRRMSPCLESSLDRDERRTKGRSVSTPNANRIICFRIDDDLERRLSRELRVNNATRSDYIRSAIARVLKQDAEERLRLAHSTIRWG